MCLDCGCEQVENNHDDKRHITVYDLQQAAYANGTSVMKVIVNILKCIPAILRDIMMYER